MERNNRWRGHLLLLGDRSSSLDGLVVRICILLEALRDLLLGWAAHLG